MCLFCVLCFCHCITLFHTVPSKLNQTYVCSLFFFSDDATQSDKRVQLGVEWGHWIAASDPGGQTHGLYFVLFMSIKPLCDDFVRQGHCPPLPKRRKIFLHVHTFDTIYRVTLYYSRKEKHTFPCRISSLLHFTFSCLYGSIIVLFLQLVFLQSGWMLQTNACSTIRHSIWVVFPSKP